MYVRVDYTCFCLRTENRSRKTHVFEYRDCGVEWGGVGGHVNVPCTSYMIYCHAAEISGIVYYVTCCYAADGVGWGGVGGHVNVPCTSCMIYCHAAEIFGIVYYVTCADGVPWGGVGWGVILTFLVLRTWYIAMLLRSLGLFTMLHVGMLVRSLGLFTTLHVATLLRSLGSFTTLYAATLLRSVGSFTTLHAATLLRSLGSFTTLHVLCGIWWKKSIPSNLGAKSDLLMVYARAWQWRCIHKNADCQLITVHALQRWRWKAKKCAPSFSRISNHQISTALW